MNVKISRELHDKLCTLAFDEYVFGSQLHGIATVESDYDYVRIISDDFYKNFTSLGKYFPNIHSWQHDYDEKHQYVWMTETQFYRNLFSGDGNMIADIVIFTPTWIEEESLKMCRTFKIIKGYLGVAKRDLKLHGKSEKKRFHALRSLFMAEKLMNKELPDVGDVQMLKFTTHVPSTEKLLFMERELRARLSSLLNSGDIDMYPNYQEDNKLVQVMMSANNVKEFKYD